mmetsp:Transcript_62820/g.104537  ORF Transcript_62820/g.104537 Transcript_62820/m.104537 type:complete len:206 (+) Transcript_62820:184-801(+)
MFRRRPEYHLRAVSGRQHWHPHEFVRRQHRDYASCPAPGDLAHHFHGKPARQDPCPQSCHGHLHGRRPPDGVQHEPPLLCGAERAHGPGGRCRAGVHPLHAVGRQRAGESLPHVCSLPGLALRGPRHRACHRWFLGREVRAARRILWHRPCPRAGGAAGVAAAGDAARTGPCEGGLLRAGPGVGRRGLCRGQRSGHAVRAAGPVH